MDGTLLRNFLVIAECGSITRAAERLKIAQPSLSQQLLRLEDELSVALFLRTARGVKLTEAGRIFADHAHAILSSMERAQDEVRGLTASLRGNISVGMPSSISYLLGVPLIMEVRQQLAEVSLTLEEGMSGRLREWIDEGAVDFAVLYGEDDFGHLLVTPLATEELCLVGRAGEFGPADPRGVAVTPVMLSAIKPLNLIIHSRRHSLRRLVEAADPASATEVKFEVDSLIHIIRLVGAGHGHAVLPLSAVRDDVAAGKLACAKLAEPSLSRQISIARHPARVVTRASIAVEDIFITLVKKMADEGLWTLLPPHSRVE